MGRKISNERRQAMRAAEMEKDTIYYLSFVPKDGSQRVRTTLLNDPWTIKLPMNPKGNTEIIDDAIRRFEANHNIKSWKELAVRYEIDSLYYP